LGARLSLEVRLTQHLSSFGDNGWPRVVFVLDDEEAPEVVYRLRLKGRPVEESEQLITGARAAPGAQRE